MALRFRLKGLAETFVEALKCPICGHDGGEDGDQGFATDHTRVTYQGIVVVISCERCSHVFLPDAQKNGVINPRRLREAVDRDCLVTGQKPFSGKEDVKIEVERLNAQHQDRVH